MKRNILNIGDIILLKDGRKATVRSLCFNHIYTNELGVLVKKTDVDSVLEPTQNKK